jgi:DNA-binding response OmpR family regulator
MRILLIEDDRMIGTSLSAALGREGVSVDWVRNGEAGAEALAVGGHALVLLDLGLPGQSGLDLLKLARRSGNRIPVLVVTARDGLDDRIVGLDLGADDYIVKQPAAYRPAQCSRGIFELKAKGKKAVGSEITAFVGAHDQLRPP